MESKILKKVQYIKADGELLPTSERIIKESALTIIVNGSHFVTSMILSAMEKEYVAGFLFAQGMIDSSEDIISMKIRNNIAEVFIKENTKKRDISRAVSSSLIVSKEDVVSCVRAILKSPVFTETEAVHSAGLFFNGKEAISIAEDLGRHNALDKVIGACLLKDVDFNRMLAASTGRQPIEMILKCRSAGIPIIATKGVPTSIAVELAEKSGITIAGLVRGDSMLIYSHPERII